MRTPASPRRSSRAARGLAWALAATLWCSPVPVLAQPAGLPELGGDASTSVLTPQLEQRLGEAIMADGRRDPTYIDDAAVNQYLTDMGRRMAAFAPGGAPSVTVFAVRDPAINAFAMPGGYIGLHSGLIVASGSESEAASVLAHEIAHVSQRHIARRLAGQDSSSLILLGMMLAALAAAAAGSGELAQGAAVFGQAAAINAQLGFSRDAEREADRVGLQMLQGAGYDPQGMARMFGRLMQTARFNERSGTGYASTHPLSLDRMSDVQNRVAHQAPNTREDDPAFWFVRAHLWGLQSSGSRNDVVGQLRTEAQQASGARAAAAWYGVARVLLQRGDLTGAREALTQAKALGVPNPMLARLEVELAQAEGNSAQALALARNAWEDWPEQRAVALTLAEVLHRQQRHQEAFDFAAERARAWSEAEPEFYRLAARSAAALGQGLAERQWMAEYYEQLGALPSALQQLEQARGMATDFYEQSRIEAKISELRRQITDDEALMQRIRRLG